MRILVVTPYPPSRIRVRSYGFLKELHRNHEVTVLARCASEQELQDVADLRAQGFNVQTVQESRQAAALRSGRALLSHLPLQIAYSRSAQFVRAIRELSTRHAYDVVHVEHLRGIASMQQPEFRQPLVWDAVDCISLLWQQAILAGPDRKVRILARIEYERTRRFEAWLMNQLQHIIVTSGYDRQAMLELHRRYMGATYHPDVARTRELSVIPNGVDLDYFRPSPQARHRYNLVFSGKMSYHANVASALFLCKHIMPLIWQEIPEATLTIVGYKPPESIRRLGRDPRIEVTGYVPDIRPYIHRAEVTICPTVYSVGIQNKVLEAMALGTPAVVAEQATRPLEAYPDHDLLVAGTAAQFASQTVRLLRDAELRASLSRNGRQYVETKHSWSEMTDRLLALYQQATEQARASRAEDKSKPSPYNTRRDIPVHRV